MRRKTQTAIVIAGNHPPRKGKLNTLAQIRRQMVRVYWETRNGLLESQDATRLVFILASIAKLIEAENIEPRLKELEAELRRIGGAM